jgi:hypothetical protein
LDETGAGFAVEWGGFAGNCRIETVKDEEIAFGVIEGGKGGDALKVIHRGEGVHLVVLDLVPGDIPAGTIGLDTNGEVGGTEVVADGGQAGHKGELRAADGEDERVVCGVGGDDVADLGGGRGEGVVGGVDVVEGLAGVGDGEDGKDGGDGGDSETVERGLGGGAGLRV